MREYGYIEAAGEVSLHRPGCGAATREARDRYATIRPLHAENDDEAVQIAKQGPDDSEYPVKVHGCLRRSR